MRQVISSANFDTGGDVCDFMHGWLNYQIEHHLWPQLSMLSYQKAQPRVKAICAKHGLPYVQQNALWRVKKTVDIMTGTASMRPFPEEPLSKAE
jgi:fatty acid desaturase